MQRSGQHLRVNRHLISCRVNSSLRCRGRPHGGLPRLSSPGSPALYAGPGETPGITNRGLPVGVGPVMDVLPLLYLPRRGAQVREAQDRAVAGAWREPAIPALRTDLLETIAGVHHEEALISRILDLFMTLFSAERTGFIPLHGDSAGPVISRPDDAYRGQDVRDMFLACQDEYLVTGDGAGFFHQIRHDADLLGIVHIDTVPSPDRLREYLALCHLVSLVAGLAIAHARTRQKLRETLQERDAGTMERKRAESALMLSNKKIAFLGSTTRHDIQNQLMVIRGNIALARIDVTDPALLEPLQEIETATKQIQWQLDISRVYESIGSHASRWQEVGEIITGAGVPGGIALSANIRDLFVYADPMLPTVFSILLDNSVRHGERVTRIRVMQEQRQNGMVIAWEDDGIGIPAGRKERIFERVAGRRTGPGLFMIREILGVTGITITETGEPGKGARFEMLVSEGAYYQHPG